MEIQFEVNEEQKDSGPRLIESAIRDKLGLETDVLVNEDSININGLLLETPRSVKSFLFFHDLKFPMKSLKFKLNI